MVLVVCTKMDGTYLTGRQPLFVGSNLSKSQVTSTGDPQGSVLCPIFLNIYIEDIADHLLSIIRTLTDDTSLAFTESNVAYI